MPHLFAKRVDDTLHGRGNLDIDLAAGLFAVVTQDSAPDIVFTQVSQIDKRDAARMKAEKEKALGIQQPQAQRQDKTARVYAYLLELYRHYLYEPNSPMRNDELYIPVLEYILEDERTQAPQKHRARFNLDMLLRNRPGTPAVNLRFITSRGGAMELYGIESPLLLLYFYNPDCTACKETTAYLENAEHTGRLQQDGQLTVVALYTDRDMLLWEEDRSIPPGWIKAYDNDMQVTRKRLYDLRAMPSIYLLDKDKRVLLKDTDIARLEEFLCHK